MKKLLVAILFITMFASAVISANAPLNKTHLKMKGKGDAKINCVYCHNTAAIPKKKGQDKEALYKTPHCAGKGCHPLPPKK
jgi:hypothetical protein